MTRVFAVLLVFTALAATSNPASFTCDIHYQTFIKSGTVTKDGRCFDVYRHASPRHDVLVLCDV